MNTTSRHLLLAVTILIATLVGGSYLRADTSNALDSIYFGNTASETAHSFDAGFASVPPAGVGPYGQTYRAPYGSTGSPGASELQFTMAVDSTHQNYLSVGVWGGDQNGAFIILSGTEGTVYSPLECGGGLPSFPDRYYYDTVPIPLSMTQGKTSVQLLLYESGSTTTVLRPVYSAYTHTDSHFIPSGANPTGTQQAVTGQITPVALTTSQVVSILQANRQNIYGSGGYYSQILARQVPAGTAGAPPEVVGLDLYSTVAGWGGGTATPDQWRDQCGGGSHGPGYSTLPDEMLTVLTSNYFLPPFTDVNGNVVAGLDHYHDATIIQRIVSCLDGTSYLQSSDGHYQAQPYPCWNGLTSTARASGHYYAGSTSRGNGWTITLEGADTDCLGRTILQLLSDSTAAPVFQSYLTQSYDADLTGGSVMRAYAYERMLNNQIAFLSSLAGAGTISQGLFNIQGWYTNVVALNKLQALYPYPGTTTTFPNDSYNYPINYPSVSSATAVNDLEQMMGVIPGNLYGLYANGLTNYAISSGGFGEAHGSISGGYDGRYGTILPWITSSLIPTAALDPNVSSTVLAQFQAQAKAAADGYLHFISPEENWMGDNDYFTLAQEDFITYRDPYNPNADSGGFNVGTGYQSSDSSIGINSALERRGAYLEALYGKTPGYGKGGGNQLCYLLSLGSYESTLRGLINVNPSSLTALPGELGQANSAFVDPETGTTAIYCNGERLYMNNNWRSFEAASPQGFGTNSFLSRIHDTTSTVDQAACVYMPHDSTTVQSDGNLTGTPDLTTVMRYGNWLIAGNPTSSSSSINLPSGNGVAIDLITGNKYNMGSSVTVPAGGSVALNMPIPTTSQLIGNGTYVMTNLSSSLVLNCPGGAATNGLQIAQASLPAGTASQWVVTYKASGYYTIKNVASGLYLTGSTSQGAALVQQPADNATDQSWQAIQTGGSYVFVCQVSGNLAINDPGASSSPGTGMILWPQDAGTNAAWSLQAVPSAPYQPIANGTYIIGVPYDALTLDVGNYAGATPFQTNATNGTSQQWTFTYNGNGFYTVQNVATGLYLNGSCQLQAADNQADQLWQLLANSSGYVLVSQASGNQAVNVLYGWSTVGQTMSMYTANGATNEVFSITPLPPAGLTATPGNYQVTLNWSAVSGATGYNIKRSSSSGGPYTVIASNVTGTSYADTGLNAGYAYYYVISAVLPAGESANTTQVSATPTAPAYTWTGVGADNNWTTVANWGSVPVAGSPIIFAGTTGLTSNNNFAANTQFGAITFNSNAGGFTVTGNAINLAGDVTNNSASLETLDVALGLTNSNTNINAASGNLVLGGVISGSGSVTKLGMGTATFLAANTYTGGTTINNGTLALGNDSDGSEIAISLGTGLVTINNGANLRLGGQNGPTYTIANSLVLNNGTVFGNDGYQHLATGTGATLTVNTGGGMIEANYNGKNVYVDGQLTGSGALNIAGTGNGGCVVFTNVADNYSGPMTISNNGGMIMGSGGADFGTGTLTLGSTVGGNGYWNIVSNGSSYANSAVFNGGTIYNSNGNNLLTGTIQVNGATTIESSFGYGITSAFSNGNTGKSLELEGVISGSGALAFMGIDGGFGESTGIWINNNANTYTGTATIYANNGQGLALTLGANNALQNATVVVSGVSGNSQTPYGLGFSGSANSGIGGHYAAVTAPVIGALSGNGNIALQTWQQSVSQSEGTGTAVALTAGFNNASTTFSGILSGTGSLIKTGTGAMTLSGNTNTYSGGTTVNGGTLLLFNTSGSALGTGVVTISSGGILGGTGSTSGKITVASGGKIAPGLSGATGTLNLAALTLSSGAILNLDIAGTSSSDKLALAGTYSATGTTTINLNAMTGFGAGTYPVITGASGISAASFVLGTAPAGYTYTFSVSGSTLNLTVSAPAAPGGFSATASFGQVALSWTASPGATTYNVKRSTTNGGPYTTIASTSSPTYTDTSVTNGTTYYYVVTGVNTVGEGAASAQSTATPPTIPSPWVNADIGTTGAAGSASYNSGTATFTILGAGADITGTSDAFQYVSQTGSGDCSIVAKIASVQNTNTLAKAGVMIRETTASNARYVGVFVTPGSGVRFQSRTSAGGTTTTSTKTGITAPEWVKVTRTGNVFAAYYSANGTTWTQIGSNTTIAMATSTTIGMGVTSKVSGTLCTATVTNVTATP